MPQATDAGIGTGAIARPLYRKSPGNLRSEPGPSWTDICEKPASPILAAALSVQAGSCTKCGMRLRPCAVSTKAWI